VFLGELLDWAGTFAGEFVERLALLGFGDGSCWGASGLTYALSGRGYDGGGGKVARVLFGR
jgi:hypothetical protein